MTSYKCSGKCGESYPVEELYCYSVSLMRSFMREHPPKRPGGSEFSFERHFGPQMAIDRAVCAKCRGARRLKPLAKVLADARKIKKAREQARRQQQVAAPAQPEDKPRRRLPEGHAHCTHQGCKRPVVMEKQAFVVCDSFPGHSLPVDADCQAIRPHIICGNCLTEINGDRLRNRQRPAQSVQLSWALEQIQSVQEEMKLLTDEDLKKIFRAA